MMVGYARTSTTEQVAGFEAQQQLLHSAGCDRIFAEQVSAATGKREQLQAALEFARQGDVLVVTKADRLARSTQELLSLVAQLEKRGIGLRVLSMGGLELDTRQATSKLMLTMLGAVAEFERTLMLERQRDGIAKAKGEGAYKGRAATVRKQLGKIQELRNTGMGATEIARTLNVSRASIYRLLAA